MRQLPPWAGIFLLITAGCRGPVHQAAPDQPWEGELQVLTGDTTFRPCGTLRKLRITGPGSDSLAHRYRWFQTKPKQWIKAWCNGHLIAPTAGGPDSVLFASAYAHMDPAVHCPPLPVANAAGRFVAETAVPGGMHREQIDLFPDGEATITTTTPSMRAEVDGHWGLNSDGRLVFEELGKHYTFEYARGPGQLERTLPNGGLVLYHHAGPADRLEGTFGRTARWLAGVAMAHGHVLRAPDLRPAMRLDSLLPDTASRHALRISAADTLGIDGEAMDKLWPAAATVEDVVKLMRHHLEPQH